MGIKSMNNAMRQLLQDDCLSKNNLELGIDAMDERGPSRFDLKTIFVGYLIL